jgi:hypothetical protein
MSTNSKGKGSSNGQGINLLSPSEASKHLGISARVLLESARKKKISCVRFNRQTIRFDLGTVIAELKQPRRNDSREQP